MWFQHGNEEEVSEGKLYSKKVVKLLFHYILRYRRYLFIAIFFVFIITSTNLLVPFYLKNVIDRVIFKQGVIVYPGKLKVLNDKARRLLLKGAVKLEDDKYFTFSSRLRYLSKRETKLLQDGGAISIKKYVLLESPILNEKLSEKISALERVKQIRHYPNSLFLVESDTISHFTAHEIMELRVTDMKRITGYVGVIILLLIIQFGASYIQIINLMKLSQWAMRDLRVDLFSHLISLEVSYFDSNPVGKLVNRITNDIETLNEFFSSVLVTLLQDLLLMLGIAVVMFSLDLHLAFMVSVTFPFIVLFTILFRIKARNAYRRIRTRVAQLNSFLNETITGIRIVQIFVQEIKNFRHFIEKNNTLFAAQMKQLLVVAIFRPLISFLRWAAIALVIYYGARGIIGGTVSYGLLVMFIAYIERFFAPVRDLSEKFDIMQSATAAGEKILSVLHASARREDYLFFKTPYVLNGKKYEKEIPKFSGKIEFKDVWFSYKPDEWVLKGVNLTVEPHQTVAIVGETGAGKSTIINILSKFYHIQHGTITIDGMPIESIPVSIVRRNIITVMQDVFLFSKTLLENIVLGQDFERTWFEKVIKMVHLEDFVARLPQRENEQVMERGVTFSGGERQLISFARALYYDSPILVLDEATSSIDTETERLIQDALKILTENRTSIIIAHRLSTIAHADRIYVLEKGKIVEQGIHEELIKQHGIYHKLYSLQSASIF